jgi:hypothetical protein
MRLRSAMVVRFLCSLTSDGLVTPRKLQVLRFAQDDKSILALR